MKMNKVYLDKNGNLFINEHEIKNVKSVSSKTNWSGTSVVIEFEGDYKSDYISKIKEHSLNERLTNNYPKEPEDTTRIIK